jgi:hypothetical protein
MPNYAIIENNTIVNVVVAELEQGSAQQWLPLPEGAGIGFIFDGTKWENPKQLTLEDITVLSRVRRNNLLLASDWTQVADAPVDKAAWATYRQELRDISTQEGFPWAVVWPTQPE